MERLEIKHLFILTGIILTIHFTLMAEMFIKNQENVISVAAIEEISYENQDKPVQMEMERLPSMEEEMESLIKRAYNNHSKDEALEINQAYVDSLYERQGEKIVYLTFDDGPSPNITPKILEILEAEDIKATFFVLGKLAEIYPQLVKETQERGHLIANHTYSHNYSKIYGSPEAYLEDLRKGEVVLKAILGGAYNPKLTRFPGGSYGNKLAPFRRAVNEAGYVYIDWNALNGDAEGVMPSVDYLFNRIKTTAKGDVLVILMHDSAGKKTTVDSLPQIIEYLKKSGYRFETLPTTIELTNLRSTSQYSLSLELIDRM